MLFGIGARRTRGLSPQIILENGRHRPHTLTTMTSPNGLICFTNCLLPLEDGSLVERDLWIDERRGAILDSQVCLVPQVPSCD